MDRREFLCSTAAVAAVGSNLSAADQREYTIKNKHLSWSCEVRADGLQSVGFTNNITGHRFPLTSKTECSLVFSSGARIEIPWWDFRLTDDHPVDPQQESGFRDGFHRQTTASGDWRKVNNLAGMQKGRQYKGYGWFRHSFSLPADAQGKDITFVIGGYDEQDWNERWVFVNGEAAGHSAFKTRWRTPGHYKITPDHAAYRALKFGKERRNLLAVQSRGYDYNARNFSPKALERFVFRPFLFDQFISVGEPYRVASRFNVTNVRQPSPEKIAFDLHSPEHPLDVTLHYELDGPVRRKWLTARNKSVGEHLLLDVKLDDFQVEDKLAQGGHGEPVFLANEAFFAVEHPAGINQAQDGQVTLWHCPGRKIGAGETIRSQVSVAGVAASGQSLRYFHQYLQAKSPRLKKKQVSSYTCYGINNQWGGCGTLAANEVLDTLRVVRSWQTRGVKVDYFTLDTGWPQNDGDLTEFITSCFPDGPGKILEGVKSLGMKFGLWFSTSWGGWANGSDPRIQQSAIPEAGSSGVPPQEPPLAAYRNGYPISGGVGRQMCMASEPFAKIFKDAVLHHVQENKARLIKFDSGNYYCNSSAHAHLPGKYSTEAMFDHLIDIADSGRAIAPDLWVTWYWGARSPFWALHGDIIAESGLFMEGSGTSWSPTLFYRDSVTLSLDQNTQFAHLIPAINKDSLGIWLSQIRWGNFMGKERWREALVMDLGRGNLLFPQLWGDPNLLGDEDVRFLARMLALARANERILMQPRQIVGDTWKNEPYAYCFFEGARGVVFCNNAHFTARKLTLPLGPESGITAKPGLPIHMRSHFPERAQVYAGGTSAMRTGDNVDIWLRPFETLMLEVGPAVSGLKPRHIDAEEAARLGSALPLRAVDSQPWMELRFADAARFEKADMVLGKQSFSSTVPDAGTDPSVLSIVITLSKEDGGEYRYKPAVVEIAQVRCRVGRKLLQMFPVPDARRFGNTQSAGCSWVLYKAPLAARHKGEPVEFAVHTYLPKGVKATVEGWLTRQWWKENSRPEADGYYGDAPS